MRFLETINITSVKLTQKMFNYFIYILLFYFYYFNYKKVNFISKNV